MKREDDDGLVRAILFFTALVRQHLTASSRPKKRQQVVSREKADVVEDKLGGGPRVVVSTAAFHVRARGSVPGLGGLKETKIVSSPSTCESQYCGEPL